jgi:hypothetical protein
MVRPGTAASQVKKRLPLGVYGSNWKPKAPTATSGQRERWSAVVNGLETIL